MNTYRKTEELTLRMLDGQMTGTEERELLSLINADSVCKQIHVEVIDLDVGLRGIAQIDNSEKIADHVRKSMELESNVMRALGGDGAMRVGDSESRPKQVKRPGPSRKAIAFQWILAAAACLLLLGIGALFVSPRQDPLAEPVIGKVYLVTGVAQLKRFDGSVVPVNGTKVRNGDIITVADGGALGFCYPDHTTLQMSAGTEVQFTHVGGQKCIYVRAGRVFADVSRQPSDRPFMISSATARAEVLGTMLDYWVVGRTSRLDVTEGKVRFTSMKSGKAIDVDAGSFAVVEDGVGFRKRKLRLVVPFEKGKAYADGDWFWNNDRMLQRRFFHKRRKATDAYPISSYLSSCAVIDDLLFSATAKTHENEAFPANLSPWGFGIIVGGKDACVVFRLVDNKHPVSGVEFKRFQLSKLSPAPGLMDYNDYGMRGRGVPLRAKVAHSYRLKMTARRVNGSIYLLKGKFWKTGETEPEEWMLSRTVDIGSSITKVGFQTTHLGCEFYDISLQDITGTICPDD